MAISNGSEDRKAPEPGAIGCRVSIMEIRHPTIKSGPDDNLDDLVIL
jgi:hypothetical protein